MGTTPSSHLGLTAGSYEAYCLDQAVWYFGTMVQGELEKAGHKKAKGEAAREAKRKQVLEKYLGTEKTQATAYADPAALFN